MQERGVDAAREQKDEDLLNYKKKCEAQARQEVTTCTLYTSTCPDVQLMCTQGYMYMAPDVYTGGFSIVLQLIYRLHRLVSGFGVCCVMCYCSYRIIIGCWWLSWVYHHSHQILIMALLHIILTMGHRRRCSVRTHLKMPASARRSRVADEAVSTESKARVWLVI